MCDVGLHLKHSGHTTPMSLLDDILKQRKLGVDTDLCSMEPATRPTGMEVTLINNCQYEGRAFKFEDRPQGMTGMEYILFAPCKDGVPYSTLIAYRDHDYFFRSIQMLVESSKPMYVHWTYSNLDRAVRKYAPLNPGKLSACVILRVFAEQEQMLELVRDLAEFLEGGTRVNALGQTPAMYVLKKRMDARFLEALMKLPDAAASLIAQDPRGWSVVHYAASTNALEHLDVLLRYKPDLSLKDAKGRTAVDVARSWGWKESEAMLCEAEGVSTGKSAIDDVELACPGLQAIIYEPSCPSTMTAEMRPSKLVRYIRRELPRLFGLDPCFITIPPTFQEECPSLEAIKISGWKAERDAFVRISTALRQLQDDAPGWTMLLFHSLKYGISHQMASLVGTGNLFKWESDIDMAILCYNEETGRCSGILFEIKSASRGKDIIPKYGPNAVPRTIGAKALRQLETHLKALKLDLESDFKWIQCCFVTPNFPAKEVPPADAVKQEANTHQGFVAAVADSPIRHCLLSKLTLLDLPTLKSWLERTLNLAEETSNTPVLSRNVGLPQIEFFRLTCWCLMRCMGVIIKHVSSQLDLPALESASSTTVVQHDPIGEPVIALLTESQKRLLDTDPTSQKATLVVGGAGTGKSLIAVQRLLKLSRNGKLSPGTRAVYVSSAENVALNSQLRDIFRDEPYVEVREVDSVARNVMDAVEKFMLLFKTLETDPSVAFLVCDQLEDYPYLFKDHLPFFNSMVQCRKFQMLWILLNPYDLNGVDVPVFFRRGIVGEECCVVLDRRIRNTLSLSTLLDHLESSIPLQVTCLSEPRGHDGIPVYFALSYETGEAVASVFADVVAAMYHRGSISLEDIVVVPPGNIPGFILNFDRFLNRKFMDDPKKGELNSLTPVIVQSPLSNCPPTEDQLNTASLYLREFLDSKHVTIVNTIKAAIIEGLEELWTKFETALEDQAGICISTYQTGLNGAVEKVKGIIMRLLVKSLSFTLDHTDQNALKTASETFEATLNSHFTVLWEAVKSLDNLKNLLKRYKYIPVMEVGAIRGYEANVILAWSRFDHYPACVKMPWAPEALLSRAKLIGVLGAAKRFQEKLEKTWPGGVHLWTELQSGTEVTF